MSFTIAAKDSAIKDLFNLHGQNQQVRAVCPICNDHEKTMTVSSDNGKVLAHCHKGCDGVFQALNDAVHQPNAIATLKPSAMQGKSTKTQQKALAKAKKYLAGLPGYDHGNHNSDYGVKKRFELFNTAGLMFDNASKNIVVPLFNLQGNLTSYQTIGDDGFKKFAANLTAKGSFFVIGGESINKDSSIAVCEGVATGMAIKASYPYMVVICSMSLGYLKNIINAGLFNGRSIHVFLDNDIKPCSDDKAKYQDSMDRHHELNQLFIDYINTMQIDNFYIPCTAKSDYWDIYSSEIEAMPEIVSKRATEFDINAYLEGLEGIYKAFTGIDISTRGRQSGEPWTRPKAVIVDFNGRTDAMQGELLSSKAHKLGNLDGLLGEIQQHIFDGMMYQSKDMAGITALSILSMFAQKHVNIESGAGLPVSMLNIIAAESGYGKESVIKSISSFYSDVFKGIGFNSAGDYNRPVGILASMPGSPQLLHHELGINRGNLAVFSDEFGDYVIAANDLGGASHKSQTMSHLTQVYGGHGRYTSPPASMTNKAKPIYDAKVTLVATTTPDTLFRGLTDAQGESGAYNRMTLLIADKKPRKEYHAKHYPIPKELIERLRLIAGVKRGSDGVPIYKKQERLNIKFQSAPVYELYKTIDQKYWEKIKDDEPMMGARLSEKAIRMAGLMALSDGVQEISEQNYTDACNITLHLYNETTRHIREAGGFGTGTPLQSALDSIKAYLDSNKGSQFTVNRLANRCKKLKSLDLKERNTVFSQLESDGYQVYRSGCKVKYGSPD